MNLIKKTAFLLYSMLFSQLYLSAQTLEGKMHKYAPTDGGILTQIAPDGKWAVINLGTTAAGQNCNSELYNCDTEQHFTVSYAGNVLSFEAVSNEDAEGYVTLVGSFSNRPMYYRFKPSEPTAQGSLKVLPNRENWSTGILTSVTPDGRYAIGYFTNYTGVEMIDSELGGNYWFDGLLVDLQKGEVLTTPGTPTGDRNGLDQHGMKFDAISPDGKYIIGQREWFMPSEGFPFVYDVDKQDFTPIGFQRQGNMMIPLEGIEYLDFPVMSPNGRYVGGRAIRYVETETGYGAASMSPYRYDIQTGEWTVFDDAESTNISVGAIDDLGTIFGNPENGTPLRHGKIFYQDKFWISLMALYQQVYGFNYEEKTGFEFSGTCSSVSADGHRLIAFADPTGESYCFDFGTSVEEACSHYDLLSSYSVSPEDKSQFSRLTTIEINFGRSIQILGKGNTHAHIYKKGKDGASDVKVRDGLSTSSGLQLRQGSATTVSITFRNTMLDEGEDYYFVLDEGAVAVASDATKKNKRIVVNYAGRSDKSVELLKVTPAEGSKLAQFDASASYILLHFDCPVKLTDDAEAYIRRAEDQEHVADLSLAPGNLESTWMQIKAAPTSTVCLYEGVPYEVVVSAASICDYVGSETSLNEEIVIPYTGNYIRESGNDNVLFSDNFNNFSESLFIWMLYDGDKRTPLAEQQDWDFDEKTPWNFSTHDVDDNLNYYATSHSLYAPSGTSDDWLLTPQLDIPVDGRVILSFDVQKWKNKNDHLWVYVIPEERNVSYLNDANMLVLKEQAVLIDEITELPYSPDGVAQGHWQHQQYSLSDFAGQKVYVAFVNKNTNQSCVMIDNVSVERELLYAFGFSHEERVVAQSEIDIKGNFTIQTTDFASGSVTLILRDASDNEVARKQWPSISGTSIVGRPIPMNFDHPLPLTLGVENKYSIHVIFDGKDTQGNEYHRESTHRSSVFNLVFKPTRRVVLEELTGTTCPNCPQGHIAIEQCQRQFGDQFIPVSIHSYDGDDLGSQLRPYSDYLGLKSAPSARINRCEGVYMPLRISASAALYDSPDDQLWYNVVSSELGIPALCDLQIQPQFTPDGKNISYTTTLRYAITTLQHTSLLVLLLEDGVIDFQENNFAGYTLSGLGEWGLGGLKGDYIVYPVEHNDVLRSVIGDTFSGSIGVFPDEFEAGRTYSSDVYQCRVSESVYDASRLKLVALLIDTQTGLVVNAASAPVAASTGVCEVQTPSKPVDSFDLLGRRLAPDSHLRGVYVKNGRKIVR